MRYISFYGHDRANNCTNVMQPCRSLSHAIAVSEENDTIEIMRSQNLTYEELTEINLIKLGEKFPIVIAKSLHFVCLHIKCKLSLPGNRFAFVAGHISKPIRVSFRNFEITQSMMNSSTSKICKPSSHGFIILRGCTLKLEHCILRKLCTAIHIFSLKDDDVCGVEIAETRVEDVHYTVYSSNASLVKLDMRDTIVIGKYDTPVPYHAISLTMRGNAIVRIARCSFRRVHEAVAISMYKKQLILQIKQCQFMENKGQSILLSFSSKLKHDDSKITFEDLVFSNNDAGFASSLHIIKLFDGSSNDDKPGPYIRISDSIFENNYAKAFFGAIYAEGVELDIKNTTFYNNSAGNEESSIQAFGGAIFVESRTYVRVFNSTFTGNTCSGFGGAVFSRGKFSAINTIFRGTFEDAMRPLLGDIVYVTAGFYLENTTWHPGKSFRSNSAIWHPGSPKLEEWSISIQGYFQVLCPVGHNVTGHGLVRESGVSTDRMSMGCRSCPRDEYSLQSGRLKVISKGSKVLSKHERMVSCMRCRYGGVCERGGIKARSNYYGYLTEDEKEVRFISCPYGYCCQGLDCRSYNSCSPLRQGTLCGSCIKGTTENLLNANCVKYHTCKDNWFWFIYFPLGIIYILFFMYIDKFSGFMKGQRLCGERETENNVVRDECQEGESPFEARAKETDKPLQEDENRVKEEADDCSRTENSERAQKVDSDKSDKMCSEQQGQSNDNFFDEGEEESVRSRYDYVRSTKTSKSIRSSTLEHSRPTSDVFSDITNIAFYFYQMIFIIRDHDNTVLTETFGFIKEASNSFFTFSIGSKSMLSLCPIEGLTPVSKSILIRSMAVYVIAVVLVMNITDATYTAIESRCLARSGTSVRKTSTSFSIRLRVTTIQITLLAYSTVTNTVINFVNCVPIDSHYVLYMDGTIECFNWFQLFAFIFLIFWAMPFPFALILGIHKMHGFALSYYGFICSLVFPFCFVLWEIFGNCSKHLMTNWRKYEHSKGERTVHIENMISETTYGDVNTVSIKEILRRFETPFKEQGDQASLTYQPGIWQGVMILRRLIIILLFTFVNSPVTRLYCIFVACLLFLMHHLVYLPYKNDLVNFVETCSSAILVVFCSINLFFAYSYVSNVLPEHADSRISVIFNWMEVLILVFFPVMFFIVLISVMICNCLKAIFRRNKAQ